MQKKFTLLSFILFGCFLAKAQVSGVVFRDFNASGAKENTASYNESFVSGITVTATLANGTSFTATTDANGAYSFTAGQVPSGTPVRIEFAATMPSSFQGSENGTSVQFVTGGTSNVNYAMNNPDDYWDNTGNPIPTLLVVHQNRGTLTNPENLGKKALLQTTNDASGPNNPSLATDMTIDTSKRPSLHVEVGSTFALAYHAKQERFFQAAFLKRMSSLGPKGAGGVYIMSKAGSVWDLTSSFDLNGVTPSNGGSALDFGSVTRTTTPGTGAGQANYISVNNQWTLSTGSDGRDNDAFFKVGTMSIGGVDVDRCYDTLFLVNMFQDRLVVMDISGTTSSLNGASAATLSPLVKAYTLSSLPGYPTAVGSGNNIRPFAIKLYGGKGYLGVVSDAMNTQNANDLKGYILQFDPHNISAGFTNVLTINFNAYSDNFWHPWVSAWSQTGGTTSNGPVSFPQPMISDIEFNEDGSMDVGIRDRWGDQGGSFEFWPVPTPSTSAAHTQTVGQGDVLHVCNVSGSWIIEGTAGSCTQPITNFGGTNSPAGWTSSYGNTGKEFYGDHAGDDNPEDGFGGLAKIMGTKHIASTCLDPIINGANAGSNYWSTSGLKWNNNTTGIVDQVARCLNGDFNSFDKANSLGDLEFVQPCPKIQIGNRLWVDADSDGIQDAGESPIDGATVELVAPGLDGSFGTSDDQVVATTSTGTDGSYYFSTLTTADTRKPSSWTGVGANDILPGLDYQIRVPLTQSAITTNNYTIGTTNVNSNGNDLVDSDGGSITVSGANYSAVVINTNATNHNYDFGFNPAPSCTKPDAGADLTATSLSSINLTGTNPTTGTWSALGSNPSGATLGTTTGGIASVSFGATNSGTYSFIYTVGACEDTVDVVVTNTVSCTCPGNLLSGSSFENGTDLAAWTFATNDPSGNILFGQDNPYAVCGSWYGFIRSLNADSYYASIYQNIPTSSGYQFNLNVYAGTHDIAQDQQIRLEFYDASNTLLSGGQTVQVDNLVDAAPFALIPYNLTGTAPTGTAYARVTAYTQGVYTLYNMVLKIDAMCLTATPPSCTKPDAGADIATTSGSTINLVGTNPTTGTWTAMSSNPTGATLGATTGGTASVSFGATNAGTYKFIYAVGTCEDTVAVTVTNCNFTPSIVTSSCHSNGTDDITTDDYITFVLKPSQDSVMSGKKYSVTATQGGNPITITMSDGTAATGLFFGYPNAFRTATGTAGAGAITLTISASNGCTNSQTLTLSDPGICSSVVPPCSTGTVTYTFRTPFQTTDLNYVPLDIPQFNTLGGTRTLTGVTLNYGMTMGSALIIENRAVNPQIANVSATGDGFIDLGATNLMTNTFINIATGSQSYAAGQLVAAGTNGSNWPGDSVSSGVPSTGMRMFSLGLEDYFSSIFIDPTQSNAWVTNITGVATNDDDIRFKSGSSSITGTTTYSAAPDLAQFVGTGLVPNLSASTLTGLSISGGGGNLLALQRTKAYAEITVTYSYSKACIPNISLVTAAATACNGTTNQYDVSGTVTFTNPPTSGVLKVSVAGEGFQNLYPPFTSPASYIITGLNADGLAKTVTATFSADTTATSSATYTAPAFCIPDPCGTTATLGMESYSSSIPLQSTNWILPLTIPQFNTQGGTRVLSKVLVSVKQSIRNVGVVESLDADTSTVNIMTTGTTRFKLGTDTIITNVLNAENVSQFVQAGILVPAQGTWTGDVLGSTTLAMSTMINNALNNGLDPRLDPTWVTNATGNPTTDDDIAVFPPRVSDYTNNFVFTSAIDLAKFVGTGNLDLTANAKGASSVDGSGNINSIIKTKASTDVTVTYIYCSPICIPPLAGADMTACGASCVNLTGTNPTTGTWTEQSGNPTGATLGATTSGIAQVCFTNAASGTYNFIYTIGTNCADTMSIVVTPKPNAGPDQTTCFMNGNGTATLAAIGTGIWTEQSGNPGTSTITTSTSATTTVTSFSAAGTYNYIWTNNGCTDTVSVMVTPSGSIGNYVWNDLNGNGMNDEASTAGINGITVELWKETSPGSGTYTLSTSTTTANDGSSNPGYYNFIVCESANYKVKFPTSNVGSNLTTQTTTSSTDNNSDANPSDGFSPVTAIDVNGTGTAKDNPTIDAAYHACGSIGNYVWNDLNGNGTNDEASTAGINGISVELWKETSPGSGTYTLSTSTTTANDGSSNPGYYNFIVCESANYKVKFPISNAGSNLTTQTTTSLTDNNSDANPSDGFSPVTAIDVNGTGTAKDNPTIDAAYHACGSIGNYVWNDLNGNGTNDEASTAGINGITVELWKETSPGSGTYALSTSTTTANDGSSNPGYYNFIVCESANYKVKFPISNAGSNLTTQTTTSSTDNNSDANPSDGFSPVTAIDVNGTGTAKDNPTIDAAYTPTLLNAIGNFVWLDNNKDGIQDSGEPGVANIPVSLFINGLDGLPGTSDDALVASTSTDAYGYYLFTNLSDGDYNVGFTLPSNYVFTSTTGSSDTDPANSDANIVTGRSSTVNLAGGETELDVDAGIIFNTPPALSSLGDYVWYDTNADGVQDANESPVAGVTVTLCDAATGNVLAITTTNANGLYLFNDLPNGNYQVGFSPKPGTIFTQNIGGTTPGNGTTNSDANPLTGKTGTVSITTAGTVITGLDAGLKDDPKASLGDFVWIDLNQDGLQDAGEPGVPGVTMTLYKAGQDNAIGGGDDILVSSTTTDVNGLYWFSNLDPGKYFVTATPVSGYAITLQDQGTDDLKDNDFGNNATYPAVFTSSQVYNLLAGQAYPGVDMGIHNTVSGLGSLGDKVWFDLDGDGIQDPTEYGVSGVTVCLLDENGAAYNNPSTGKPYIQQTDANGNYLFVDLPAGNYEVAFKNIPEGTSFSPVGGGTTSSDSDPNPATGITSVVTLGAGQNRLDVDAGIVPGVPSGKGSLGNLIWIDANNDGLQDPGEQGVPGVIVQLCQDTNGDGVISGTEITTPVATQVTDAQGFYMFAGLDAGIYQVHVVSSSFPASYTLQAGKNDQGTNDAIDSDVDPTTESTGLYILAQGEDNLTVDAGIYNPSATNSVGDKVWLDLNADGIQDPSEVGVPGVPVSLLDIDFVVIATTMTDANGNYHFGNLPNGVYSVQVTPPAGFNVTTQDAGTDDAADSDIDPTNGTTPSVTLTGGTNITDLDAGLTTNRAALGNYVWLDTDQDGIQDAGELGVPGVTVLLTRPGFGGDGIPGNADDANPVASAITDGNGLYFFSNLEPGTYDVQFTTLPTGLIFTTQNVTTPNDAGDSDADPVFGMITGITLVAGQVDPTNDAGLIPVELGSVGDIAWFDINHDGIRDANETPVPGTTVTLKDAQGNVVGTAITDGTGHFLFTKVRAGSGYTLTFANLPTGATITVQGVGSTSTNSDADPLTGITNPFVVVGGQKTPNIDAGITLYIPLPVSLQDVAVTKNDCKVTVSWSTTSEQNVSHFTIMRKASSESQFTAIAKVKALGKSSTLQKYMYREGSLSNGSYVYYINTSDIDGNQYASDLQSIQLDCNSNSVAVFPNPTTDQINIRFNSTEFSEYTIRLTDLTGKVVMTTSTTIEPGTKVVMIPVSTYAQGLYHLSVSDENGTQHFTINIGK